MRGRVIGVINLADKDTEAAFGSEDLNAVLMVTAHASWALQSSALHGRVRALREQAVTDSLTGLSNRRYLETRLREEAGRARRHGAPFTLLMLDLDNFKAYNDREGHPAGDALLTAAARVVRTAARDTDLVSRYGGDEFAVVSPDTRVEEALLLAERIRAPSRPTRSTCPVCPRRAACRSASALPGSRPTPTNPTLWCTRPTPPSTGQRPRGKTRSSRTPDPCATSS